MENSSHTPANQRLGLIGVFSLHVSLQQGFTKTEFTDHLTKHHSTAGCCIHPKKQQKNPNLIFPILYKEGKGKKWIPKWHKGNSCFQLHLTQHVTNCQPQQPGCTATRAQAVRINAPA